MSARLAAFLAASPATAVFALLLTIAAWLAGVSIQRRTGSAALNPVLIAIVIIGLTLRALHMPYATYLAGAQPINFLLGPAIVALAIPLVRAIESIRRSLWPLLAGLTAGAITSMVTGYGIVRVLGGSQVLALTMLPKSLTTPIAIDVARSIGGISSIAVVLAILAGILVAMSINGLMRLFAITNPSAIGLAAGTAGSGIGSSRVIGQHPDSAAFAAVSLGLNGIVTGALAPLFAHLLKRW